VERDIGIFGLGLNCADAFFAAAALRGLSMRGERSRIMSFDFARPWIRRRRPVGIVFFFLQREEYNDQDGKRYDREGQATVTVKSSMKKAGIRLGDRELKSHNALAMAAEADCVLVATNHTQFDYPGILEKATLIVDARNAFKNHTSDKIVRL